MLSCTSESGWEEAMKMGEKEEEKRIVTVEEEAE